MTKFYPWSHYLFIDVLSKNQFIKQNGLNLEDEQGDQEIKELIIAHRWKPLCKNPVNACALLVKEFNANMKIKKQGHIFVWRKWIAFNEDEIQKAIGSPEQEDEFLK